MSAAAGGFGLKINSNGNYTMAIAERHPSDPACFAYSAEYITGYLTYTPTELLLAENFWRSKFLNSCAADQNVDTNVEPGSMRLRYQIINRNAGTGDYWELKIFNPDNSSFSYYRK